MKQHTVHLTTDQAICISAALHLAHYDALKQIKKSCDDQGREFWKDRANAYYGALTALTPLPLP